MHRFLLLACALLLAWPAFAETGVRIVVPAHDIARGTVITSSDLAYQTVAELGPDLHQMALLVIDLDCMVAAIGDIEPAFIVHGEAMRGIEIAGTGLRWPTA